jgi:membrane associated rhomboid family serine protease
MRRFEKMIGCVRLALIYFVSGIGGYLASASFVPYMVCYSILRKFLLLFSLKSVQLEAKVECWAL